MYMSKSFFPNIDFCNRRSFLSYYANECPSFSHLVTPFFHIWLHFCLEGGECLAAIFFL